MKPAYLILCIFFFSIVLGSCSNKVSERLAQLPNNNIDAALIYPEAAYFVFSIPDKNSWQWYQADTPAGRGEYGWWAEFQLDGNSYSTGFRLFKPPAFNRPESGRFKELIEAGQVDVGYGYKLDTHARVKAITRSNRLIIVLREKEIINKLKQVRPDSILFHKQPALQELNRNKVKAEYFLTPDQSP